MSEMMSRAGFKAQMAKLGKFIQERPEIGKIALAVASGKTFSSTSQKLRPCLSVEMMTEGNQDWRSVTVPAGTSAGIYEPSSLTKEKSGFQVAEAKVFDEHIQAKLEGRFIHPLEIDETLEETNQSLPPRADGLDTPFSRIGGPTATATSLTALDCLASAAGVSREVVIHYLYNELAKKNSLPLSTRMSLPVYMSKIVDGGMHGAKDSKGRPLTPIQEFLFLPIGYKSYSEALSAITDVNERFWGLMRERGFNIEIGAEAGIISPQLTSAIRVLQLMSLAIRGDGKQNPLAGVFIGLDVAASEIYGFKGSSFNYYIGRDGEKMFGSAFVDNEKLTEYYKKLVEWFPIISIEDPYPDADECQHHWKKGFAALSTDTLVITDDFTVTQPDRVKMAVEWGVGGLLTKLNQGGTFTRSSLAMQIAKKHGWVRALSHRSSEPAEFDMETMVAIGTGAEFLKVTVGSAAGGGGGRESRVNKNTQANKIWNTIWRGIKEGDVDWEVFNAFWSGIPVEERLDGLPYQGALMMAEANPPSWLKRTQQMIAERYEQLADWQKSGKPIESYPAYRFGASNFIG